MKLLLKISLLLLLPAFVQAQQQQKQLDSLYLALKNTANDTLRMDYYGSTKCFLSFFLLVINMLFYNYSHNLFAD